MTLSLSELDHRFLVTPKLLYFFAGCVFYTLSNFRLEFCEGYLGMTITEAGAASGIISLTGFLLAPIWSGLADLLNIHRLVLAFLAIGTALSFELLILWPTNYWYTILVLGVFGAFVGGIFPLTDYQILRLLVDKFGLGKALYGRQRMMGTVSYGLTPIMVGLLIDLMGLKVFFLLFPIFASIFVVLLHFFGFRDKSARSSNEPYPSVAGAKGDPQASPSMTPLKSGEDTTSEGGNLKIWLKFGFLLISVFVTGCGRQLLQVFLLRHLKSTMGLSGTLNGLTVFASTIFSILFMFMGAQLLATFGEHLMLLLGMVAMGIRLGAYAYLPTSSNWIPAVYAIELLNGVAFSFTHLAGFKIASDLAPRRMEATAQALYTGFYMQLPLIVIAPLGGYLYQRLGAISLFSWTSCITLGYSAILFLKLLITRKVRD